MAVFKVNICKFGNCGIVFDGLGELIHHIEDIHLEYDPIFLEQHEESHPSCVPMSYVLRFYTDTARRENVVIAQDTRGRSASSGKPSTSRSGTPIGMKFSGMEIEYSRGPNMENRMVMRENEVFDEEVISGQSENSNDSWTNAEEFSSEFILRYGSRNTAIGPNGQANGLVEKPFVCPVPGCKKRYKNVNGIKYHSKNGHKKDGRIRKGYKCHCGKSYKTAQGLKNHSIAQHFTTPSTPSPSAVMPLGPPQSVPSIKSLSVPMVKAVQGLVVQTASNSNNNRIRQVAHVIDASQLDNAKVIRTNGNVTTLTIPRSSITNLQLSSNTVMQSARNDGESTWVVKTRPSNQIYTISNESELGVLTPASSPRSSPNDKSKHIVEETQTSTNAGRHVLPLIPVTPSKRRVQLSFGSPATHVTIH